MGPIAPDVARLHFVAPVTPETSGMLYDTRVRERTDGEAPFAVLPDPGAASKQASRMWLPADKGAPTSLQERVARGWRGDTIVEHPALYTSPQQSHDVRFPLSNYIILPVSTQSR